MKVNKIKSSLEPYKLNFLKQWFNEPMKERVVKFYLFAHGLQQKLLWRIKRFHKHLFEFGKSNLLDGEEDRVF